jgi:hypothetical protein
MTGAAGRAAVAGLLLLAAGLPIFAASGSVDGSRVIDDKWVIAVGGYLTEFKTDASVGSGRVLGTSIRFEDQLGVDPDQTVFRLDGLKRFGKRHAIGFGLWTLNREGATAIDGQIEYDGNVFDVGAEINSRFDTDWLRLDWRYSLLRTDKGEAGLSAGLSVYEFETSLEGLATVSDGMGGTILQAARAEEDVLAPVPTIGMFMNYAFRPNLILRVKADFLDLDVGDIEGKVTDTTLLFEWYFSRHAGVGIGLNRSDIDVRSVGDNPFLIDFSQSGFLGYFSFTF